MVHVFPELLIVKGLAVSVLVTVEESYLDDEWDRSFVVSSRWDGERVLPSTFPVTPMDVEKLGIACTGGNILIQDGKEHQ